MIRPRQQAHLGVLLASWHSHWQYVPAQGVLHARLSGVDKHAGIAGAEPALPFEQIREALTLGL